LVDNPQHVGALTSLGLAYYRQEAFEAAIDALERTAVLAPDDARIRLYLGLACLRQGQLEAARQQLAAFLERTRNRSIADHTLRAVTVLEDAPLSDSQRDYLAYSLETAVQQEQRVQALREQVRSLELERSFRGYPLVLQRSRRR
jgi:tetratricopeptide (TPR) repeat protein